MGLSRSLNPVSSAKFGDDGKESRLDQISEYGGPAGGNLGIAKKKRQGPARRLVSDAVVPDIPLRSISRRSGAVGMCLLLPCFENPDHFASDQPKELASDRALLEGFGCSRDEPFLIGIVCHVVSCMPAQ